MIKEFNAGSWITGASTRYDSTDSRTRGTHNGAQIPLKITENVREGRATLMT